MFWTVDPVAFYIGDHPLRYYSILVSLFWVALVLTWAWQTRRAGYPPAVQYNLLPWAFVTGVLFSRLAEVLFYRFDEFVARPLMFFQIWNGGLSSHGAAVAFVLGIWLYGRHYHMPLLEAFDRLCFATPFLVILVRLGNFFNSEIVGRTTTLPWGVRFVHFDGGALPRHPVQLYEALLGLAVLIVLLLMDRRMKEDRPNGLIYATATLLYFGGRMLLEFTKAQMVFDDSSPITMGQLLSLPFLLLGAIVLWLALSNRTGRPRPAAQTAELFGRLAAQRASR